MEIRKVGVLGCGLMGSGIAQVAAMAGFDVDRPRSRSRNISTKVLPASRSRSARLASGRRTRAASHRRAERRKRRHG